MIRTTKPHLVAYNGFCNKCSIIDPLLKRPIRDYVEGCFDLGIWNNMVCWPLRSSQQLTTGTSVISLGGLGSYNGTITGSAALGADGVFIDSSAKKIATNIAYGNKRTFFTVARFATGTTGASRCIATEPQSGTGTVGRCSYSQTNLRWFFEGHISDIPSNAAFAASLDTFNAATFSQNGDTSTIAARVNGGTWVEQGTRTVAASGTVSLEVRTTTSTSLMTCPVAIFIEKALTDAESLQLYSLYKTTLGAGLGLP